MPEVKNTVYVNVTYFDGQGEDEDGTPYFVATCDDLMFTTDGETFEELLANIRECLELNLATGDPVTSFGVAANARVKLVMELPENYAETA